MAAIGGEVPLIKVRFDNNFYNLFIKKLAYVFNIIDTTPPFIHSGEGEKKATLGELGEIIGYKDLYVQKALAYHDKRIKQYTIIQSLIMAPMFVIFFSFTIILLVVFGIPGVTSLVNSLDHLSLSPITNILLEPLRVILYVFLYLITLFLYFTIPTAAGMKVVALLTDKPYAESLTIWTVICLTIQLREDDNVLKSFNRRKTLLYSLNDLVLGTLLLSQHFSSKDEENKAWSRNHFRQITRYIRDREQWVIAPKATTLEDLRRDFLWLSEILITCEYGNINWTSAQKQEANSGPGYIDQQETGERSKASKKKSITEKHHGKTKRITSVLSFLLGIVVPVGILLYLISIGGKIWTFSLDVKALTSAAIALSLLGLDKLLNLGIVTPLVDITKGLNDLG